MWVHESQLLNLQEFCKLSKINYIKFTLNYIKNKGNQTHCLLIILSLSIVSACWKTI